MVDPAVLGSVIGISILACLGLTVVLQDKASACVGSLKRKLARWKLQRQPLLPTERYTPVVVNPASQWKMKQLLTLK